MFVSECYRVNPECVRASLTVSSSCWDVKDDRHRYLRGPPNPGTRSSAYSTPVVVSLPSVTGSRYSNGKKKYTGCITARDGTTKRLSDLGGVGQVRWESLSLVHVGG